LLSPVFIKLIAFFESLFDREFNRETIGVIQCEEDLSVIAGVCIAFKEFL